MNPLNPAGRHVLYVDDDESILQVMSRLLERRGYRVSAYADAREALAALRSAPDRFDVVVTDFNMSAMSGLDVARAVREISPDLPVLLASGYITAELQQKAPASGVSGLLYKPYTIGELCAALDAAGK